MESFLRAAEIRLDDVAPGERSVVARISTDAVDRYRTVVDPAGAALDAYRRNPIVLWDHGLDSKRGSVPIGRNVWVKYDKATRSLIAKTKFADDEFSDGLFRLYQDGALRGFSIRGNPDPAATGPPQAAEIRKRPELAECNLVYRKWELVEYSAVAVPGNQDALATAVARGLWVPDSVRSSVATAATSDSADVEIELPPLTGARRYGDVHAALVRLCRSRGADAAQDAAAVLDLQLRGRV